MNKKNIIELVLFLIIILFLYGCTGNISNNEEEKNIYDKYNINNSYVAKFFNDAEFAISLIFDDNDTAHYEIGYDILKNNNLVATFNVSPGYVDFPTMYLPGYTKLQEIGCEIGAHGWYHIDMTSLDASQVEIHMCKKPIELIKNYFGVVPISISLNNAQVNDNIRNLFKRYYYVSKHVQLTDIERDKLPMLSSTDFNSVVKCIENARKNNKWLMIAMHGLEGSGWKNGCITKKMFSDICGYLNKNKYYVGTSGEVGLYEYLYSNVELNIVNISESYAEIIPKISADFKYPDGYEKIITVCIPCSNGEYEKINFNFNTDSRICVSKMGVVVK